MTLKTQWLGSFTLKGHSLYHRSFYKYVWPFTTLCMKRLKSQKKLLWKFVKLVAKNFANYRGLKLVTLNDSDRSSCKLFFGRKQASHLKFLEISKSSCTAKYPMNFCIRYKKIKIKKVYPRFPCQEIYPKITIKNQKILASFYVQKISFSFFINPFRAAGLFL